MEISKLEPGMVLYDVHSYRMGNTTMRTLGVWRVRIVSVDGDSFTASWNGNPPKKHFSVPSNWRKKKPTMVRRITGSYRLARRHEAGKVIEYSDRFQLTPGEK